MRQGKPGSPSKREQASFTQVFCTEGAEGAARLACHPTIGAGEMLAGWVSESGLDEPLPESEGDAASAAVALSYALGLGPVSSCTVAMLVPRIQRSIHLSRARAEKGVL